MKVLSLSAVLAGALVSPVLACDVCSVYCACEANGSAGKGFYGGMAEQFTYFNTLQVDGQKVPNDGEYINSSISQLYVGYFFNNRISAQLNVPLIYRSFGSDTAGHSSAGGLGDMSLIGNFTAYQKLAEKYTFTWNVLGGVKFPTGNYHRLNPSLPDFASGIGGHDLTMGSGSFDGIVGTGFFVRYERVFLTANMQYAVRTSGAYDYRFDNDWTWSGGPGVYLALKHNYTLALQAVVSGEAKGQDTIAGVPTDDTGERAVALGPQFNFTWKAKLSATLGAELPVSIDNTGEQLVPDFRIRAAVTWRF